jgi:hypothetical protein
MTTVHKIRENVDVALDRWESWASAIESQLNKTREQALEKLEENKKEFLAQLDKLEQQIKESKSIAEAQKTAVIIAIDQLKIQLLVDRIKEDAKVRSIFEQDVKNIEEAIAAVNAKIDENLEVVDDSVNKSLSAFFKGANEFDAQMRAYGTRLDEEMSEAGKRNEEKRKELESQLKKYKEELKAGRKQAEENWDTFSTEFTEGHKKIMSAFKNLFS